MNRRDAERSETSNEQTFTEFLFSFATWLLSVARRFEIKFFRHIEIVSRGAMAVQIGFDPGLVVSRRLSVLT